MKFVKFRQKFRETFEILLWNIVIGNTFLLAKISVSLKTKNFYSLHKQAIFSTFSDKMAADSLHFIIYCFTTKKWARK